MRARLPSLLVSLFVASWAALPAAHAQEADGGPKIVATAEPASGYIVVTAPTADLSAGPTEDAAVFGAARKGDILPLKGKQGKWYLVATGEATYGWIRTDTAAIFFYPEFLPTHRPPADLVTPPSAPARVPPPFYWYPPSRGWDRSPRWDSGWWGLWLDLDDDRRFGRDRRHDRDRYYYRDRDRDWDGGRDRDRDWDRDYRDRSWQ